MTRPETWLPPTIRHARERETRAANRTARLMGAVCVLLCLVGLAQCVLTPTSPLDAYRQRNQACADLVAAHPDDPNLKEECARLRQ